MDRSFSSVTCVNLFADFDNETENRLKLSSENCLGKHGEKRWKEVKTLLRKWNFQPLSSIVCGVLFIVIYPLCHIVRFELRVLRKKPSRRWVAADYGHATNQQGEMWFIDTQHRFTGIAVDSFVRFNNDDRWSELISFVFNAWTTTSVYEKLAGKIELSSSDCEELRWESKINGVMLIFPESHIKLTLL